MIYLDDGARFILQTLHNAGESGYLVGGAVRDLLRGVPAGDFDMACSASTETLLALFPGAKCIGGVCGTVSVPVAGRSYEVTPYRKDGAYIDHRHPEQVERAQTIEEDLARRDFTVNAIAYDGEQLVDPFGGAADIEAGLLRCVGDPVQRFAEDALRILRLYRFASVLGFEIEESTAAAAQLHAQALAMLPMERVREELQKLMLGSHPDAVLPLLRANGLDAFSVNAPRCTLSLDSLPQGMLIRWWGLAHLTGSQLMHMVQSLGFSAAFYRDLAAVDAFYHSVTPKDLTALKRQLRGGLPLPAEELYEAFCSFDLAWQPRRTLYETLKASKEPYTKEMLAVSGGTLMAFGLRGAEIGRVLELLLDAVIAAPQLNEPQKLLGLAKQLTKLA